jgi:hypothetical protein
VLGDVEQQDAGVLGLEPPEPVRVAHRDGHHVVGGVVDDLAGRHAPLLEVLPQVVVLVVEADDLAVPATAVAAQVHRSVLEHQVALQDVGGVVDLAVRVLTEAAPADGEDHAKRGVRPEGQCGDHGASSLYPQVHETEPSS